MCYIGEEVGNVERKRENCYKRVIKTSSGIICGYQILRLIYNLVFQCEMNVQTRPASLSSRLFLWLSSLVTTFRGRLYAFLESQHPPPGNFTPGHISEFSLNRTIVTYLPFYFHHSRMKLPHFPSPILLVSCATDRVTSSDFGYRVPMMLAAFYVPRRFELELLSRNLFIAV